MLEHKYIVMQLLIQQSYVHYTTHKNFKINCTHAYELIGSQLVLNKSEK